MKTSPSLVTKNNPPYQTGQCIFNRNIYTSLKNQGIETKEWDNSRNPTIELSGAGSGIVNPFNVINMCANVDMQWYGRNGVDLYSDDVQGSRENTGGRCTMKDLDMNGPGNDFKAQAAFSIPLPTSLSSQTCNTAGDACESKCNVAEFQNTPQWDGNTIAANPSFYAGQQYVTPETTTAYDLARGKGLCHRVDSGCVTKNDLKNIQSIFGTTGNNPIDIKYQNIEANSFTQVNGRLFEKFGFERDKMQKFDESTRNRINEMYLRNVRSGKLFSDWKNHSSLWQKKPNNMISGKCNVVQIKSSKRFIVTPYVLNPNLGSQASFSHVIYNDRFLMECGYTSGQGDDITHIQQFFGHHFAGGTSSKIRGKKITSPTPLFSYCPDNT